MGEDFSRKTLISKGFLRSSPVILSVGSSTEVSTDVDSTGPSVVCRYHSTQGRMLSLGSPGRPLRGHETENSVWGLQCTTVTRLEVAIAITDRGRT